MTAFKPAPLSALSVLLAVLVAIVWGLNYIMVKVALDQFPPITLCALRFFLAAFPALFFVPKPKTHWRYILGYGFITFALQFTLLFLGIAAGVSPGIAALISQLQVFFATFLAWLLLRQSVTMWQIIDGLLALAGIAILFTHHKGEFSFAGFMLILLAAFCWGLGTLFSVKFRNVNTLSLIVWSSFIACLPLFILALVIEEPLIFLIHPEKIKIVSLLAITYITYASTYFGYGCWTWLLSRHSFASISPFALLSPIVAMVASTFLFDEKLDSWKILSAVIVILGLAINIWGKAIVQKLITIFNG